MVREGQAPGHTGGSELGRRARWGVRMLRGRRPTWGEVRRLLVTLLLAWATLLLTIWIMPGISAEGRLDVLLAAVLLGVLAAVLRPLLAAFALRLGWAGVVARLAADARRCSSTWRCGDAGHPVDGFWPAFWASWMYGALVSVVLVRHRGRHCGVPGTHLLQRAAAAGGRAPEPTRPGVVMIQIDGLSAPLAEWAVRCGQPADAEPLAPVRQPRAGRVARAAAGDHAGQPGRPAARRAATRCRRSAGTRRRPGRLVVTNHPARQRDRRGAAVDGRGLLADGGVSISNVFSGDAPTSLLTMSTAGGPARRRPARPLRSATYLLDPFGLTRSLVLTAGEMVKELHQARRQRVRGVEPRIHRAGLLRGCCAA